jgi:hypothetical protein
MPDVTFLTFNYGNAGRYANGPGICLSNFVKDLRALGVTVEVFSKLKSWDQSVNPLSSEKAPNSIKKSKIVHQWSGLDNDFIRLINMAQGQKIIGPNVIDGVSSEERTFLEYAKYDKILVVNERLKFLLSKKYNIDISKFDVLMVGPDQELWAPSGRDNGRILWKGNSYHLVKDINFGLEVSKILKRYEFEFIGYPQPYHYLEHVSKAKDCHLYFSTSLSETMGLALCESWCSGLPSVTHPKIYLLGENYKTGIITNRDIGSYCEAITEIMENNLLYTQLKNGAINFIKNNFTDTAKNYIKKYLEN